MTPDLTKIGRFDRSFIVVMIRDFFLVLLAVVVFELGLRFVIVLYEFHYPQQKETAQVAENLAVDVINIMRNEGGPVASSTFYPILKKNHEAIGYEISLEPSEETITSIHKMFDFTPRGIQTEWSKGEFYEKTVDIHAEQFCLSCHIDAKLGTVLGRVKVRSYLNHHLESWWSEVGLTAVLGLGKILFHTTILFFLLKVRMEPLLSLRSVVASLAKAGADLHHRAVLKSEDEFSELAHDLNHFLDRLCLILEEVSHVLENISGLNLRLSQVNAKVETRFNTIQCLSRQTTKAMLEGNTRSPLLTPEWKASMQLVFAALKDSTKDPEQQKEIDLKIAKIWHQFDETSSQLGHLNQYHTQVNKNLGNMNSQLEGFRHHLKEMSQLEENMENISAQGQKLLQRLTGIAKNKAPRIV